MEQTEREQLLLRKKHLESRIATHQAIVDQILKDTGPKLPNLKESLKKPQDLVAQLKEELAVVNRQLAMMGWAVFEKGNHIATSPLYDDKAEAEKELERSNRLDPGEKGRRFVGEAIQRTTGGAVELDTVARGGQHLLP